ncbi:hypothetical protein [Streptomyces sp. L2]|uniref:hypothetical protein n=1 Tax=Streptomyces sp. L2 TaxID=2162665 RepID=UPI001012FA07|nr:hypothetical protein [Streptomyces sp. L2]
MTTPIHPPGTPSPYEDERLPCGRPLSRVRADREPGEGTWIMESAAARTLRAAAEEVPGVRAGSCRIIAGPNAGTSQVTVHLGVQVPLSTPDLTVLADEVRRHVTETAELSLGLDVAAVDIHITDLADAPGRSEDESGR